MERDFYCRDNPSSVAVPLKFEEPRPPVMSSLEAHCPEVASICLDLRQIREKKGRSEYLEVIDASWCGSAAAASLWALGGPGVLLIRATSEEGRVCMWSKEKRTS